MSRVKLMRDVLNMSFIKAHKKQMIHIFIRQHFITL